MLHCLIFLNDCTCTVWQFCLSCDGLTEVRLSWNHEKIGDILPQGIEERWSLLRPPCDHVDAQWMGWFCKIYHFGSVVGHKDITNAKVCTAIDYLKGEEEQYLWSLNNLRCLFPAKNERSIIVDEQFQKGISLRWK